MLLLAGCAASAPPPAREPCTGSDAEAMALKSAECRARVARECKDIPDEDCPAVAECDRWGEGRCE